MFSCCFCLDDRCIGHVFVWCFGVVVSDGTRLLVGYTCSKVCATGRVTAWSALAMSMVLDKPVPMVSLAGSVAIRWRAQLLATMVQSWSEVVGTTRWATAQRHALAQ